MEEFFKNRSSIYQQLEQVYRFLEKNDMRLFGILMESSEEFESGYNSDHYYRREDGSYDGASFPLPVYSISGTCEIFINFDSIDFYAYIPSCLSDNVMAQYHILDTIELQQANGLFLFRMSEDEDASIIIGFLEELKKAGANI